ncbi:hypothetical protein ACFL0Y_04100 [Patescibacteria group bacterium]
MKVKKRALFSLYHQKKAVFYARQLIALGWEVIATQETFILFKKNNIPAKNISNFLKLKAKYPFPPTLHPALELALTTKQKSTIDLVYDTTYPLSKGNDVGGHTLLALAAKGKRIAVFNNKDMETVLDELASKQNKISFTLRRELINKVYAKVSRHYASLIKNSKYDKIIIGKRKMMLLEGENPYQSPSAFFQTKNKGPLDLGNFQKVSGLSPCFTNMADFDSIIRTLCLTSVAFNKKYKKTPFIVVAAKHGNPCGLAVDWKSPKIAIEKAFFGNPVAIFGGELITNFSIDRSLAKILYSSKKKEKLLGNSRWVLDLIVAPDFDQPAISLLGKRKMTKIFKNKHLKRPHLHKTKWLYRMVRGGFLRQPPYHYILNLSESKENLSLKNQGFLDCLIIAWASAWSSNHGGNEVAIAKNRKLLGVGGGPSTIEACRIAINRANRFTNSLKKSVFAADAFFPFIDAPQKLIKAGCAYGLVPKGGMNDELVKECFAKAKVKVFYLPPQFRGFCRH